MWYSEFTLLNEGSRLFLFYGANAPNHYRPVDHITMWPRKRREFNEIITNTSRQCNTAVSHTAFTIFPSLPIAAI